MNGITLRGHKIHIIFRKINEEPVGGDELGECHRSLPRASSVEGEGFDLGGTWNYSNPPALNGSKWKPLILFDKNNYDLLIEADCVVGVSDVFGEGRTTSVYAGVFIAKSYHQILVSPWGLAWWDDDRPTTSYVAPFSMIKHITRRV